MPLKIGTSNIVLPVTKKDFPAELQSRSRLYYYSTVFNSAELNTTFYKVPQPATFTRWANDVSEDFKFTIKLWKEITHQKKLVYSVDDVALFMKASQGIGEKKGCLLIQFPASITIDYQDHVEKLLDEVIDHDEPPAWRLCVEFRHKSWYDHGVYDMLQHRHASLVIHDIHASRTPLAIASLWRTIYLRFHGPLGDYRGNYDDEVLRHYASLITDWLAQGKDVYAYFNNTMGNAFQNAMFLRNLSQIS